MHVASVSCGCCKSRSGCYICCNGYIHMLQASVLNVSPVSDFCSTCFIWVLHMFSSGCYICFTYMLQVFYLDGAYILQLLHMCFPRVSDICCKCFNYFGRMLQMFSLDVIKVDLMLYMLQWTLSVATARPTCMCMGVEEERAVDAGNRASTDRDKAAQDTKQVQDKAARDTE
jgi:hypothetical protein